MNILYLSLYKARMLNGMKILTKTMITLPCSQLKEYFFSLSCVLADKLKICDLGLKNKLQK